MGAPEARRAFAAAVWWLLWLAGLPVGPAGCARRAEEPPATPRQTLARLIAARQQKSYRQIKRLVVAERAPQLLAVLMAVDDFLLANRRLCDYVRDRVGLGLARMIDQSALGSHLEVFSPYVELLDESVTGEVASVSFWVDGRLPVRRARLRRVAGRWRYDPGPGYSRQLPEAFRRMAAGLRRVRAELESGRLPPEALRRDPQRLVEEVRLRLLPGVKLLPPAAGQEGPGG